MRKYQRLRAQQLPLKDHVKRRLLAKIRARTVQSRKSEVTGKFHTALDLLSDHV